MKYIFQPNHILYPCKRKLTQACDCDGEGCKHWCHWAVTLALQAYWTSFLPMRKCFPLCIDMKRQSLRYETAHNKVCGLASFSYPDLWTDAVEFMKAIFWQFEHHKKSVIFHLVNASYSTFDTIIPLCLCNQMTLSHGWKLQRQKASERWNLKSAASECISLCRMMYCIRYYWLVY